VNESLLLLSQAWFPSQGKIKPGLGVTKQNQPWACQGHWTDLAKPHSIVVARSSKGNTYDRLATLDLLLYLPFTLCV